MWDKPYNEQISNGSKILLLALLTTGSTVFYEDLQKAFARCAEVIGSKYEFHYSEKVFKYCLKEIDNTFITTSKDDYGNIGIRFLNPSIQDYLIHYLEENPELLYDITSCSIYFTQLFYLFTFDETGTKKKYWWKSRKLLSSPELSKLRIRIFIEQFDRLSDCNTTTLQYKESKKSRMERRQQSVYFYLNVAREEFEKYSENKDLNKFIIQKLQSNILLSESYYTSDLTAYADLLSAYKNSLKFNSMTAIHQVINNTYSLYAFIQPMKTLADSFCDEFRILSKSEPFKEKVAQLINEDLKKITSDETGSFREDLDAVQSEFGVDCSTYYHQLDQLEEDWKKQKTEEEEMPIFQQSAEEYEKPDSIDNMFYSLINKAPKTYKIADDLPF